MTKYLLLKHYRGGPEQSGGGYVPMDQWTPEEVSDHIAFMNQVADDLRERGEFVDAQALSPEGTFVRSDGPGKPPVTDGPFAETKDLIAGWMVIDVESEERAHEAAAYLSSAPGQGRRADQRVARGAAVPRAPADRHGLPMEELLRDLSPQVLGILVRRGADFAAAEDAVQEALVEAVRRWPDEMPAEPKGWLVTVAWRRFLDAQRSDAARQRRELADVEEPPPGPTEEQRRHAAAALPVLPPDADPGVRGGAHAAGRRRADHPADRGGLPGARGDDGAADQPGQADRRRGRPRRAGRPGARCSRSST